MSGLGDAFAALKNVMLLHERVDDMGKELERVAGEQKDLNRSVGEIDKRLVRIETLVEVAASRRGPPRLE